MNDFKKRGSGFDCASMTEIKSVLRVGGSVDDIIYSNSIKNEEDLIWAETKGINVTTADSIDELIKIRKYAPNMRILWRISIQ